jgi:hypothetical protein
VIDFGSQRSRMSLVLGLGFTASLGLALGACFDGLAAEGLPCETDAQCGPQLLCEDKYCGGVFACADGSFIEVPAICDGTADCADGSDEDSSSCGVVAPNQCESEPDQPLAWIAGPRSSGAAQPIKVVADGFVDGGQDDVLIAGAGGTFVKIVSFGMGPDSQAEYFLNGPSPAFGNRTVADLEVADLEGDGDLDIVIITHGDGVGTHVFENDGNNEPAPFGPAGDIPLDVDVRGMELGRFDDDDWIDLVAVVDVNDNRGQVFTALGNPLAVPDGNYFTPEFSMVQLDYQNFFDSAVANVDGDTLDDLIVTGDTPDGPSIWVVQRNGEGVAAWAVPDLEPTPGPALDIAVGFLDGPGDPAPDLVAIIGDDRLLPLMNVDGRFIPGDSIDGFGTGLSGVTLADINCDALPDWLVNVQDPAEVRIWLGDGGGRVLADVDLSIPSLGVPSGGLAVSQFDQDQTWDIIQASDAGSQLADPEIFVWFTSDPMMSR